MENHFKIFKRDLAAYFVALYQWFRVSASASQDQNNFSLHPKQKKDYPSIFVAKQHKYIRLVKEFRNTAMCMLQNADDDCDDPQSNAALAL